MRCEEARRQMIKGKSPSKELTEHLGQCQECSHYAEATNIMGRLLKNAQGAEKIPPLSAVRDRVNMMAKKQSTWEKIMSRLTDQYQTRPRLMAGMSLTAAVFFFVLLVPFSVDQTIGWKISMNGIDANAAVSPKLINATFAAAGLSDIYVTTIPGDDSSEDIYVETPSREEARQIVKALVAAKIDSAVNLHIEPVIQIKSRTLLAQVYDRVKVEKDPPVRIRFEEGALLINGKGIFETLKSPDLTDKEVIAELENLLEMKDGGEDEVFVDVKTSDDGRTRIIEIQASNASLSHALSNIELHASDKVVGVKYKGDVDVPDSVAIVELSILDKNDTLTTRGIKMKILIDLDEE